MEIISTHYQSLPRTNDDYFRSQQQTIYEYLREHVATGTMVSHGTGISQKCVTRHKRALEASGKLWVVGTRPCEITGHRAAYLTTDPKKRPGHSFQIKLF